MTSVDDLRRQVAQLSSEKTRLEEIVANAGVNGAAFFLINSEGVSKPYAKADEFRAALATDISNLTDITKNPESVELEIRTNKAMIRSLHNRINDMKKTWRLALQSGDKSFANEIKGQAASLLDEKKRMEIVVSKLQLASAISSVYERRARRYTDEPKTRTEEWVGNEYVNIPPDRRLNRRLIRLRRQRGFVGERA